MPIWHGFLAAPDSPYKLPGAMSISNMLECLLSGVPLAPPLLWLTAQPSTPTSPSADRMTSLLTQHLTPLVSTLYTWHTILNQARLTLILLGSATNLNPSTLMFGKIVGTNSSPKLYAAVKSFTPSLPPKNVPFHEQNWPTSNPNTCPPAATMTFSSSSSS